MTAAFSLRAVFLVLILLALVLGLARQNIFWGASFLLGELTALANLAAIRKALRLQKGYRGAVTQMLRYLLLAFIFYLVFQWLGKPLLNGFLAGFCLIQFGVGIGALILMTRNGKG